MTVDNDQNQPRQARAAPDRRPAALAADLRDAVLRTARQLRAQARPDGVTPGQYAVLAALKHGPLTPRELADREQMRPPPMTRLIHGLAAQGHIHRRPDPADRRRVLVSLAPSGEHLILTNRRQGNAWLAARLGRLTPAERHTLDEAAKILRRLI